MTIWPSPPHEGVDGREEVWIRELCAAFELSSADLDANAQQGAPRGEGALGDVFAALAAARGTIDYGGKERNSAAATDVDGPPLY